MCDELSALKSKHQSLMKFNISSGLVIAEPSYFMVYRNEHGEHISPGVQEKNKLMCA